MLLKYVKGELNRADAKSIESHMADCPMCSDEIEGIEALPFPDLIKSIESDINKEIDSKNIEKKRHWFPIFRIAASILLLLGLTAIIMWQLESKTSIKQLAEKSDDAQKNEVTEIALLEEQEIFDQNFFKEEDTTDDIPPATQRGYYEETSIYANIAEQRERSSDRQQANNLLFTGSSNDSDIHLQGNAGNTRSTNQTTATIMNDEIQTQTAAAPPPIIRVEEENEAAYMRDAVAETVSVSSRSSSPSRKREKIDRREQA